MAMSDRKLSGLSGRHSRMLMSSSSIWRAMGTILPRVIASEAFKGKSRIQQHQMVYSALQGQMGGALHALALETSVPK